LLGHQNPPIPPLAKGGKGGFVQQFLYDTDNFLIAFFSSWNWRSFN
jgi:hypothetical protein